MFEASIHNPFKPVDWRWRRAKWLAEGNRRGRTNADDPYTSTIRRYIAQKSKCKTDLDFMSVEQKYPGIFWSEQIFNTKESDVRWVIEARLLANENIQAIADKCGTTAETVMWYERTFFNVLPNLRKLDWIVCQVMGRAVHSGLHERDYDLLWKLLGYAYGPIFLDAVIFPIVNPAHVTSVDQIASTWQDLYHATLVRKASVSAMTVPTAYNQCNIIQLYNEVKRIDKEAEGGSLVVSSINNNIYSSLSQLPFFSGKTNIEGRPKLDSPSLPFYDEQGAELRATEMINVALGNDTAELKSIAKLTLPEAPNVQASTTENK